jgi:hypothetical protein
MNKAAYGLCAKASFVWYTKVENVQKPDKDGTIKTETKFYTYIDVCQAYLSKTRKPKEMTIPLKVANLTYPKFKQKILDVITNSNQTNTNGGTN